MLQAAVAASREALPELRRISLLYSAARPSELAHRTPIEELAVADDRVRLELRVTRNSEPQEPWSGATGRISTAVLAAALAEAGSPAAETLAYVCGPPAMTDELVAALQGPLAIPKERVRSEKWW
uniref:Oxidoreductase FAD/NAD(P)-binding domain-containing protein n=2 Tax=Alexandrium monilatum TaxID=311494 RepID=A0A7S4PV86_9DINO|mmetsp:Transcript_95214/g.302122  ORF Transcript_95214/g.302122 Transcript_95214/m.302122 type:complete len:125 (+) Transcript_95214:368-742(+)